ncbi:uncharacterized protein LOC100679300 isoform X2 [Nasonia vitripennis]|uniref:C2H2-type domain-containing protein n=1 Tax=Nasonia vitripennis TaxID=7425 RepID=A0A7M7LKH4_NASVI|nr:uncharacterized protein LOC100679300 isoform X2 [Nasonia vitripennis]
MTDIGASAAVFTNSAGGDLLQQAFQQVVDEEDQDGAAGDFVAFLHSDAAGESQVIQLTAEQAAALGITFKVDDEPLQQLPAETTPGFQEFEQPQEQQQVLSQKESQRIINELTQSGLLKHSDAADQSSFCDWTVQQSNGDCESYQQDVMDSNITLETMKLDGLQQEQRSDVTEHSNQSNGLIQEQEVPKSVEAQCNENLLENRIQFSIASNNEQTDSITESQAQILQRYPVILPSSQFIIKPAQTVLTPVKNIRILPNTSKITTTAQTSQNSLLLPKATLLNTVSPRLLKAMPMGTQFLSTANNIPTQILNTSRMFAKTSDSSSTQVANEPLCRSTKINTVPTQLTQNLIRQSPAQKPVQTQIQKGNLQQFFTPVLKTSNVHTAGKNASLLNNNASKLNTSTLSYKTVQYPSQMLKTTHVKSPVASLSTSKNKNANTPVIFRTTPVMKSDDHKPTSMSTPIMRTQTSNTPVSILKPQAKAVSSNFIKQSLPTTFVAHKSPQTKPIELSESLGLKTLAAAKLKQSMNSFIKNIKKKTVPTSIPAKQESTDANKPLGSSENPIQIVQQGTTFHSMQHLTQAQLKQIAQVLHQRSQDSTNPNEKVVYRLVFPDEADLKMKSPTSLLKNRNGKRGRPKKSAIKPPTAPAKPVPEEEPEDSKDDRKKVVARTRSGRLSRPPRHMVRDYKHLHHLDFMQPDLDDSDGGYSDYNTNGGSNNAGGITNGTGKAELEDGTGHRTELLAGLEMPKRKISDHFRCPTCSKIYLGRTRMARHFEMHPDHGSIDLLPPPTVDPDPNKTPLQDPLKRKGKKRGPWAYVTPEAKSERRQLKLREAISVCENTEIAKIAGKPVANALSLFDLLLLKSGNNVRTFLSEIKELVERIREKTSTMLSIANNEDKLNENVVDLNGELLCDVLALNSGFYRVNEAVCSEEPETEERNPSETFEIEGEIPPPKKQKTDGVLEEGKENIEERLSSGFSESSDLSVSDFLNERRNDSIVTSANCPEVLSALTLIPKNNSAFSTNEVSTKVNNVSKGLNSGAEIQTTDNPGFQKLSINVSAKSSPGFMKEATFTKLGENLDSSCNDVFTKFNGNYDQNKLENLERTFIKLEPTEEGFIKLENGMLGAFHQEIEDFGKIQNNGFHYVSSGASDGFRKLVPKTPTSSVTVPNDDNIKIDDENNDHEIDDNSVQITTSSCSSNNPESSIFEASDNLDISKMTNYDHITHLDILNSSGAIDKNLLIDEKLVEHLHLVDNSNIVDELVSERLKSMMPENLLESNLLHSNDNLDTELDFDELSEEFNRNTRS